MFPIVKERRIVLDWMAANAIGEVLGLGVAALIAVAVTQAHAMAPAEELLVVTAAFLVIGAYEGAVVGAAQWTVLRRLLPAIGATQWIGATMGGALVAWMFARIPTALADWKSGGAGVGQETPGMMTIILGSAAAGAGLGVVLGSAQWLVLRAHAARAGVWIGANALAWAAAMPLIFIGAGLPDAHTSTSSIAALLLMTVGVAGAMVGAIEGLFLRLLVRSAA